MMKLNLKNPKNLLSHQILKMKIKMKLKVKSKSKKSKNLLSHQILKMKIKDEIKVKSKSKNQKSVKSSDTEDEDKDEIKVKVKSKKSIKSSDTEDEDENKPKKSIKSKKSKKSVKLSDSEDDIDDVDDEVKVKSTKSSKSSKSSKSTKSTKSTKSSKSTDDEIEEEDDKVNKIKSKKPVKSVKSVKPIESSNSVIDDFFEDSETINSENNGGYMRIFALTPSRNILINMKLYACYFTKFYCKKKKLNIGVDMNLLHDFLKIIGNNSIMTMYIRENNANVLVIEALDDGKISEVEINLIESKKHNVEKISKFDIETMITMNTADFHKMCKSFNVTADSWILFQLKTR